jgi:hypothetical protein
MAMLPAAFAELEPFAPKWCKQAESERWTTRMSSSFDELQALYDAGMARIDEALDYIDQFPLDDMPEDAQNLMFLLYSLVTVSFTVEAWGQVKIPDTGAADLFNVIAPVP